MPQVDKFFCTPCMKETWDLATIDQNYYAFLYFFRSAFCHGNGDDGKEQELVKNVNMLFSSLDPSFIYEFCAKVLRTTSMCKEWEPETVQSVGHPVTSVGEIVCLVSYLVDLISPDRDSSCLEAVLIVGTQNLTHLKPNNVLSIINLCEKLMLRIGKPPSLALSIQFQNLFISLLQAHIFMDETPIRKLNGSLMNNRPMKPNEYLRKNLEVWSVVFSAACRILPIFLISGEFPFPLSCTCVTMNINSIAEVNTLNPLTALT